MTTIPLAAASAQIWERSSGESVLLIMGAGDSVAKNGTPAASSVRLPVKALPVWSVRALPLRVLSAATKSSLSVEGRLAAGFRILGGKAQTQFRRQSAKP
jgi:hypothetical protein